MNEKYFFNYIYIASIATLFALASFLVFLTGKRPALIKKKLAIGALLLTLTGSMNSNGCICISTCYVQPFTAYHIEWKESSIFTMDGIGFPDKNITTISERKASSKNNAIAFAQAQIYDRFADIITRRKIEKNQDKNFILIDLKTRRNKNADKIIINNFKDVVTSGKIIQIQYKENERCVIKYQVWSPNLREKVFSTEIPEE